MKSLTQHITEKLVLNSNSKIRKQQEYNYHPKTKEELKELVKKLIEERGNEADLNDIDTSAITDISWMFYKSEFNGDLSGWNVGNVTNMMHTFAHSKFTGENGDISRWDVSSVEKMNIMFAGSNFNQDISKWDVSKVKIMQGMFMGCPIKDEYKPKFNE
jgi:surface protein